MVIMAGSEVGPVLKDLQNTAHHTTTQLLSDTRVEHSHWSRLSRCCALIGWALLSKVYAKITHVRWLPCTERIFYRRPCAIKNQQKARNVSSRIRELALSLRASLYYWPPPPHRQPLPPARSCCPPWRGSSSPRTSPSQQGRRAVELFKSCSDQWELNCKWNIYPVSLSLGWTNYDWW